MISKLELGDSGESFGSDSLMVFFKKVGLFIPYALLEFREYGDFNVDYEFFSDTLDNCDFLTLTDLIGNIFPVDDLSPNEKPPSSSLIV
jgi:hypothetical protein